MHEHYLLVLFGHFLFLHQCNARIAIDARKGNASKQHRI